MRWRASALPVLFFYAEIEKLAQFGTVWHSLAHIGTVCHLGVTGLTCYNVSCRSGYESEASRSALMTLSKTGEPQSAEFATKSDNIYNNPTKSDRKRQNCCAIM